MDDVLIAYLQGVTEKCPECNGPMGEKSRLCRKCWGNKNPENKKNMCFDTYMARLYIAEHMVSATIDVLPGNILSSQRDPVLQEAYYAASAWRRKFP